MSVDSGSNRVAFLFLVMFLFLDILSNCAMAIGRVLTLGLGLGLGLGFGSSPWLKAPRVAHSTACGCLPARLGEYLL